MKRTALLVALLALAGCGGGDTEPASVSVSPQDALITAAMGYGNALLAGDMTGVRGYVGNACTDEQYGELALGVANAAQTAKGATMTVTAVEVDGERGRVTDFTLSDGAPDAIRRALRQAMSEGDSFKWHYVNGEWFFRPSSCS